MRAFVGWTRRCEKPRGMGMTTWQALWRVELPLALPLILTGIRTAAVEVISSATLAAFVGSGGLGIYITRGFALYDYAILLVGAVPVALLTLSAELLLACMPFTKLIHAFTLWGSRWYNGDANAKKGVPV